MVAIIIATMMTPAHLNHNCDIFSKKEANPF